MVHQLGGRVEEGPVSSPLPWLQKGDLIGLSPLIQGMTGTASTLPAGVGKEEGRAGHSGGHQSLPGTDGHGPEDLCGACWHGEDGRIGLHTERWRRGERQVPGGG